MFENVLGTGSEGYSLPVIKEKFERGRELASRYSKLISALHGSTLLRRFPDTKVHLMAHIETSSMQIRDSFDEEELSALLEAAEASRKASGEPVTTEEHYQRAPEPVRSRFAKRVQMLLRSDFITGVIQTCTALTAHKGSLQNETSLKDRFLLGPGHTFAPIAGVNFNFKALYTHPDVTAEDRRFLLVVLHKLYTITHGLYKVVKSPDVNIGEFSSVIMTAIESVRKQIPGCDDAFKKILDSVGLLQNNFGSYYEDFVASNNSSIIMENFVLDVAKTSDTSPTVTRQFHKIISHYRNMMANSGESNNPRISALFSQIDNNFEALARSERGEAVRPDGVHDDTTPEALEEALNGTATAGVPAAAAAAVPAPVPAAATAVPPARRGRNKKKAAKKPDEDDISNE